MTGSQLLFVAVAAKASAATEAYSKGITDPAQLSLSKGSKKGSDEIQNPHPHPHTMGTMFSSRDTLPPGKRYTTKICPAHMVVFVFFP